MKQIDNGQSHTVSYCRAYKEDLQQVIDLMTVNNVLPQLISGDYEFTNADELFTFLGEKGKNDIRISCKNPYIRVRGDYYLGRIIIDADNSSDQSICMLYRVSKALDECQERPWYINIWFIIIMILISIGSCLLAFSHLGEWLGVLFINIFAISGVAICLILWKIPVKANYFFGVSRESRKTFWQRNGDNLTISLLSNTFAAIIGAIIGVVGTLVVQKYVISDSKSSPTVSPVRPNSK